MGDQMSALFGHIVARVEQDVQFLVDHNYITQQNAAVIFEHLPIPANQAPSPMSSPAPATPPTCASAQPVRARAHWGYNENGKDPNDLSFSTGDIIEIVEETTDDWWTGKLNNRQGLFPSNHVEKLKEGAVPPAPVPAPQKPYKPFKATFHGQDAPPSTRNSLGLQQDPGHERRVGKYGVLKNTMANSAAGGAGFGAGAAIGRGLVRKIF